MQAANFYTKNISAIRLRELQTWTEIAREKNMIVVTGSRESDDLGPLLGMIKERTPISQELDENTIRKTVQDEFSKLIQGGQIKRAPSS